MNQSVSSNITNFKKLHILFVCSKNQWRSPTAESIWRKHPSLLVKSGGTSPNARHPVNVNDVNWADVIYEMEEKHKSRLQKDFGPSLREKPLHVLDIPDDFKYMDPELIEELTESVGSILGLP